MKIDMQWVRETHTDLINGMKQHADELEARDERHFYGPAINRIELLMQQIEALQEGE
jgi:hypothetical protein